MILSYNCRSRFITFSQMADFVLLASRYINKYSPISGDFLASCFACGSLRSLVLGLATGRCRLVARLVHFALISKNNILRLFLDIKPGEALLTPRYSNKKFPLIGGFFIGVPGEVRTRNLWRRRPTLYPIELRVHNSYMASEANFLLRPVARFGHSSTKFVVAVAPSH